MQRNKPLIVITGPTASGKSSLSVDLAKLYIGEIISADSMQVYKYMDIGTAKTNSASQQGIPHHLIDFLEPEDKFSVAEYTNLAHKTISEIHENCKIPFLVGGTGLYISSVVENIQFFDIKENKDLKKELLDYAKTEGNKALWNRLYDVDPKLAKALHPNNQGRIIRGLEVFKTSGKPLSYWQEESVKVPSEYNTIMVGISFKDRNKLYEEINARVDAMISRGLIGEAKALFDRGLSKTANQAIGYKELWSYLDGKESLETAVNQLKQNTRRYAKRQMTWMRGRKDLIWIYRDDYKNYGEFLHAANKLIEGEMNIFV